MLKHLKQIPTIQGYSVKCIPGIPQYLDPAAFQRSPFGHDTIIVIIRLRQIQGGARAERPTLATEEKIHGPCRIFGSKGGTLRINHLAFPGSLTPAVETLSIFKWWLVTSNHHSDSTESVRKFGGHPNFGTLPKYTQMGILFTNKRTVQYQKWPAIGPKRYPQSSKRLRSNMSSLLPLEFWRYSFPTAVFEGCRASTWSDSGRDHGRPARVQNGPGDHNDWAHSISFFEKCTSDSLV
jgi:hypothetical protein